MHISNTIAGIMTIRACKNENKFFEEYSQHIDYHTRSASSFININRWFAIRLGI